MPKIHRCDNASVQIHDGSTPGIGTAPVADDDKTLSTPPPQICYSEAVELAWNHYGLVVQSVTPLTAERDQNLLCCAANGTRWLMKFANPGEDRLVTDFQTAALCHLEAADSLLPVPRVRRNLAGSTLCDVTLSDGRSSSLRILSWVEGTPLVNAPQSRTQRQSLAVIHSRLTRALSDFAHPGQGHILQWDSSRLDRMAHLLPHVDGPEMADLVAQVLHDFHEIVRPVLPGLRRQVIYNDLNSSNVLVDSTEPARIAGIIDFGDIVEAPLVNDLAVAAAYQFGPDGDRAAAGEFIAAWHKELPLTSEEIRLLPFLIEARLALTLLITGYRASRYPENAVYILRNNAPARAALTELRRCGLTQNALWISSLIKEAAA